MNTTSTAKCKHGILTKYDIEYSLQILKEFNYDCIHIHTQNKIENTHICGLNKNCGL